VRPLLPTFYARLSTIFLVLILALGGGCIVIGFRSANSLFDGVEQLLNRDYARSIAGELAPLVAGGFSAEKVRGAIHYMMVLNPMVEIYLLDSRGRILAYFLNPAERIVRDTVDLGPVRAFLDSGGHTLLRGADPRAARRDRPFSAAPLAMGGEQGYVYIILGGEAYDASLRTIRDSYYLRAGLVAFLLALFATLIVGLVVFFLLTRRLRTLSAAVQGFQGGDLARRVEARGTDELGALGRSFNGMAATIEADVEKLRHAERLRRDLVGNISHDLRSPLTSLQGSLETLAMKDPLLTSGERRSFLDIGLRNAGSLQKLVEELFELATLEARQAPLKREPVQVADLAQDVALKLAPQAGKAGVRLDVDQPRELPLVACDIGMIERVLTNLIDNALRFTPAGGSVKVGLERENGGVRVSVADTGAGISPEDLPHVFERFYRADKSRDRATGGAGLGLAIARQIVELHGGALDVHSRVGEGASFSFTLASAPVPAARRADGHVQDP
jgi:signal transduction histidine kinase